MMIELTINLVQKLISGKSFVGKVQRVTRLLHGLMKHAE